MRMHAYVWSLVGLLSLTEIAYLDAQPPPPEDAKVGKPLEVVTDHRGTIYSLVFSPDGKELATSSGFADPKVNFWDPRTGKLIRSLEAHPSNTWAVAYSPDGTRLVTSAHASPEDVCVWDAHKHTKLHSLKGHKDGAKVLAISPDGKHLVSIGTSAPLEDVAVWDLHAGKLKHTHPGLGQAVQKVHFLANGCTLLVTEYSRIRHWKIGASEGAAVEDFGDLEKQTEADDHARRVFGVTAMAPDNRIVAVGVPGNKSTRLLESITGKEVWRIDKGIQRVGIAFSPDGRTIARATTKGAIQVFDWPSEKEILTLKGHDEDVYKLAFSPDGTRLASVGSSGQAKTVLIWDVSTAVKRPLPQRDVGMKDVEDWLAALSSTDAGAGYRAVWNLVGVPDQAVPQLRAMIGKGKGLTFVDFNRFIVDLDSEDFATRQTATHRLIAAGTDVVGPVKDALKKGPSLEQKRRLEKVLAAVQDSPIPAEQLLVMRALIVLEQIDTPEARKLVEEWAKTAPETHLTTAAREVLQRQANRPSLRP